MNRKTICIIGDSHVGALRLALNEGKSPEFLEFADLFGTKAGTWSSVHLRDGSLVSDDSSVRDMFKLTGGREKIDLNLYEAFCIVGCGISTKSVWNICRNYSTVEIGLPKRQLVSGGLFRAMIESYFRDAPARRLMQMIATVTDKPIYRLANPLLSEDILNHKSWPALRKIISLGVDDLIMDAYDRACESIFDSRCTLVPQPEVTRSGRLFTKRQYCVGSKRLRKFEAEHDETEFEHMNAAYGAEVLKDLATVLAAASDDQARSVGSKALA